MICPQLEETVRGIDPDVPTVLIENAPGSGDTPRRRIRARDPRRARAGRRHADRALHRDVRGVSGARSAVRGGARRRAPRARTCGSCSRADGPIRSQRRARRRGRAGVADAVDLRRAAAGRRDSRVPRRGRRARLAAQHRHEHAAEDLSVPALGPSDRRDAPAHAHAGARRRGGVPDGGDAGGIRRRASWRRSPIRRARARRRAGAAARRDEVQLRGLPGADAPGLRAPARRAAAPQIAGGVA